MSRNDELNSRAEMIEDALQEGYAKGLNEGLAEGREEGKHIGTVDAARKMLASGMSREQVAAILQLSTEELNAILCS
jgi:predicted transposase/invertase (TIGR01784 family)